MTQPYAAPAPRTRAPRWVWWAIAGAFAVGLLIGWGAGIVATAVAVHHQVDHVFGTSDQAPAPSTPPQDCPLPYPGNVIPPGCPTS